MEEVKIERDDSITTIEPGISVTLDFRSVKKRLNSTVLGFSKGEALIVRLPLVPGIESITRVGETVVLRYMWKGVIYGFNSAIMDRHGRGPVRVLFLEYPEKVEKVCLRQTERIQCHFPAEMVVDESALPGIVLDLSAGGVRFMHSFNEDGSVRLIQINQEVILRGHVVGMEETQQIWCSVRYITMDESSQIFGLRFLPDEKEKIELIDAYVRRIVKHLKTSFIPYD